MQETNARRKARLNDKCHIRLREQMDTDARYQMRKAIGDILRRRHLLIYHAGGQARVI